MLMTAAINQAEVRPETRGKAFGTVARNGEPATLLGAVEGERPDYHMPAAP
jgi:hypothetical protein